MMLFIFILFTSINSLLLVVNGQSTTACVGVENGQFVNNPTGCDHFFFCNNQQASAGQCPPGYLFHPITQYCDFPNNVDCSECSPRGIQTLPIEGSCSRFIRCNQGIPTEDFCSSGLHFDPSTGGCNLPSGCISNSEEITDPPTTVSVPPPITVPPPPPITTLPPGPGTTIPGPPGPTPPSGDFEPDCTGAQIFHAHPTDCSRFFICFDGIALHGQCPAGELWNQFVNTCDPAANVTCVQQTSVLRTNAVHEYLLEENLIKFIEY